MRSAHFRSGDSNLKIAYTNSQQKSSPPGHLPSSRYVRRFWTPLVGTTGVGCYILITEAIDDGRTSIPPREVASSLGLDAPEELAKPIAKLVRYGLIAAIDHQLLVNRTAPTLTQELEFELPPHLREIHRRLRSEGLVTPAAPTSQEDLTGHEEIDRARLLALSLLRMGMAPSNLESEMHRRRLHPAVAYQAATWAIERYTPSSTTVSDDCDLDQKEKTNDSPTLAPSQSDQSA